MVPEQCNYEGYQRATGALCYALLFFENFPLVWACYAEVQAQWHNSIAARWAKKLLYYRPTKTVLDFYDEVLPDGLYNQQMSEFRATMREVIATCNLHPEWSDSYQLLCGIEYYQRLLGKFN